MAIEVVLLGDSVFDNVRYVGPGESVTELLSKRLDGFANVTLLARDGSITSQVRSSLLQVPRTATHLVLSSGGNDALSDAFVLNASVGNVKEALDLIGERVEGFNAEYVTLVRDLRTLDLPFAVCTIYDRIPGLGRPERTALSIYNDVITRTALRAGADVIDLREIFTEVADFSASSPIEPSFQGGHKLALAIENRVRRK